MCSTVNIGWYVLFPHGVLIWNFLEMGNIYYYLGIEEYKWKLFFIMDETTCGIWLDITCLYFSNFASYFRKVKSFK